jgi:hypothetical protein
MTLALPLRCLLSGIISLQNASYMIRQIISFAIQMIVSLVRNIIRAKMTTMSILPSTSGTKFTNKGIISMKTHVWFISLQISLNYVHMVDFEGNNGHGDHVSTTDHYHGDHIPDFAVPAEAEWHYIDDDG